MKAVLAYVQGRLLDIGCGMNQLVRTYRNGTGVDVYQWGDVDLVVENTAHLPFPDESFDTVTIIGSLNHILNRGELLKEVYRLLKPEGRNIVTMIPPSISRIWHFLCRPWDADQKERGMKFGEVFGLTLKEVRYLLQEAGLAVVEGKRFMFYINTIFIEKKSAEQQREIERKVRK